MQNAIAYLLDMDPVFALRAITYLIILLIGLFVIRGVRNVVDRGLHRADRVRDILGVGLSYQSL